MSPVSQQNEVKVESPLRPLFEDFSIQTRGEGDFLIATGYEAFPIKIKEDGFIPKGGLYLISYLAGQDVSGDCLDVGCGETGVIAQFLKHYGASSVTGVDVDDAALEHARISSAIAPDIEWLHSDVYKSLSDRHRFDLIVSNPPQMPCRSMESIHDDGGNDGLLIVRDILQNARPFLKPGGRIYMLLFDFLYDFKYHETEESVATIAAAMGYHAEVVAVYNRTVRQQGKTFERLTYIEDMFDRFRFTRKNGQISHKVYVIEFRA